MSSARYLPVELMTSPHARGELSTDRIMRHVVYALAPVVAAGVYCFGLSVLLLVATTTTACLACERAACALAGKDSTLADWSAAITGVLLGLTLPPGFPLWMAAAGGAVSILVGKTLFGGLGFNVFNPALVGRAFLQAAFPVAITTWTPVFAAGRFTRLIPSSLAPPFARPAVDAFSGATPLAAMKFEGQAAGLGELFLGGVAGSAGETSAAVILLAGAYLAARRMLDWRIPAGILATVAALSALLHAFMPRAPGPGFMLCSGGLMLGAVFMATDMVTSPVTPRGVWLYAALVGALVVVIRVWGGLPEGVMYAILLGNALAPGLDRLSQPRIYGARPPAARDGAGRAS